MTEWRNWDIFVTGIRNHMKSSGGIRNHRNAAVAKSADLLLLMFCRFDPIYKRLVFTLIGVLGLTSHYNERNIDRMRIPITFQNNVATRNALIQS